MRRDCLVSYITHCTRAYFFQSFFEMFIFERGRERWGGAEREEDRGSKVGSALTAESLMQGSNS